MKEFVKDPNKNRSFFTFGEKKPKLSGGKNKNRNILLYTQTQLIKDPEFVY